MTLHKLAILQSEGFREIARGDAAVDDRGHVAEFRPTWEEESKFTTRLAVYLTLPDCKRRYRLTTSTPVSGDQSGKDAHYRLTLGQNSVA